jgi:integrase
MKNKGLKMTFHQLRHLFASTANDLGVADVYIQKMGGWASNNILKTIYTHTSHEKEDEFQSIIDNFYLGLINAANTEI